MATDNRTPKSRGPKEERKPIFERLQPFAPWDQRSAPNLLDEAETKQRASELGAASDRLAEGLRSLAGTVPGPEAVGENLRHLANVAEWSAGVWRQAFDTGDSDDRRALSSLCDSASRRTDPLESLAALARVAVPRLLAAAVLLRAELGDDVTAGRDRWLGLLVDELETTRADLELVLQSQLGPGDGRRLAAACAEVAKTVC